MNFTIPDLEKFMVVVTPYKIIPNITPNKKYIILDVRKDKILLMNDKGVEFLYPTIQFIECEIFFSLSLYITFSKLLSLSRLPLHSLDK